LVIVRNKFAVVLGFVIIGNDGSCRKRFLVIINKPTSGLKEVSYLHVHIQSILWVLTLLSIFGGVTPGSNISRSIEATIAKFWFVVLFDFKITL